MDIQARKRNKALTCSFFVILAFIFSLVSCDNFNKPVREYFEFYTTEAVVGKAVVSEPAGTYSGITCVESNGDKEVRLYLMNPKDFNIASGYSFDDSRLTGIYSPWGSIASLDKNTLKLTFTKEFLEGVEKKGLAECDPDTGNPTGRYTKDISGTINLSTSDGGVARDFKTHFHFSLMVNSAPPRIQGAMYQRNKSGGEDGTEYIICFNIPSMKGTVHEKDTKDLYIGSEHYRIDSSTDILTITDAEGNPTTKLSTDRPSKLKDIDGGDPVFDLSSEYVQYYYHTGIRPEDSDEERKCKISLVDDYNFKKEVVVSSQMAKLEKPSINLSGSTYVRESDGKVDLIISHNGDATYKIPGGGTSKKHCSSPVIEYEIYKVGGTSNPFKSGSARAPVKIPLEKGKYYVHAYAQAEGFADGDKMDGDGTTDTTFFTLKPYATYYVKSGSSTGNGSRNNPYNSIQKCIDAIQDDAKVEFMSEGYTINLLGDITGQDNDFSGEGNALALFKKDSGLSVPNIKFTLNGNGHKIDAARDDINGSGRVIYVNGPSVEVVLDNVVITGGHAYGALSGGGINITDGAQVTLQNGTLVKQNSALQGGGIYISNNPGNVLNMYGATVSENSSTTAVLGIEPMGGGICYMGGTINIKNTNIVDSNHTIDGTTPSNLYIYCDEVLNVTGPVTGSTIRVSKNYESTTRPDIGESVTFTKDFNYMASNAGTDWINTDLPGKVFKCDVSSGTDAYPVIEEGGEAAFAKTGAGVHTAFDFTFDFDLDRKDPSDYKHKFYIGHQKVFTVTDVNVKLVNTDLTYNESERVLRNSSTKYYEADGREAKVYWSAKLFCGRELTEYAPSVSGGKITIQNTLPYPETFILRVTATYMGVPHSKDFTLYGIESPQTVSSLSGLQSAISNMQGDELTLLATSKIEVTGSLAVPAGKTVTLIRSDDISDSTNMIQMSEGANLGSLSGGTLYIDGDNFEGRCPLITGATFGLFNVHIKNYTNKNGDGGAISNGITNYLAMENCVVENCHAKNGGALNIRGAAGNFYSNGNYSGYGIKNCRFKDCTATEKGGVIYKGANDGYRSIVLLNNTFENCSAETGNLLYVNISSFNCKIYRDIPNPVYDSPTFTANSSTQVILDD